MRGLLRQGGNGSQEVASPPNTEETRVLVLRNGKGTSLEGSNMPLAAPQPTQVYPLLCLSTLKGPTLNQSRPEEGSGLLGEKARGLVSLNWNLRTLSERPLEGGDSSLGPAQQYSLVPPRP